jgi:polysaccharide chain length determinant protein (PEP-CTERM system associated)
MATAQSFVSVSRRPPDVEDYIDMFRRYRSWLIGPMFAGLVISVVVAFLYPNTYVSSAVMRITPQQISDRLVPTVINMQMQQRLQQLQQEILSRGSLGELIARPALDLYKAERARLPMEDVVQEMKAKIRIQPVEVNAGQGRITSAFTISFPYPDRFKAQAVVRELVTKFTEQNVTVQRNQAANITSFLNEEMKNAREKVDRLEAGLTKFKAENLGRLPEQFQSNVAQLQSLQMQLSSANESLSRNQQQKLQLETQLQNYNTQLTYYTALAEDTVTTAGPAQVRNERLNNLNLKIMDLQSRVAAMAEMWTKDHPDLKAAQAQLASLEKQKADAEREETTLPAPAPSVKRVPNLQNQRMIQDLQGSIAVLKTEMQNINLQMDDKMKAVAELNRQIAGYQSRIESSPQLEQQYAALMRDYGLAKQGYEEMSRRGDQSETAKDLEEHKAGENLEVLDPASDPMTPTEPDRPKWAAIGTGAGLMFGFVLAAAKEMKNTSLKNLKDVRAYTNLPVLSSIPLLENALLVRRKRRLQWLAWSSAVVIGSIAMSGSAYFYYFGGKGT